MLFHRVCQTSPRGGLILQQGFSWLLLSVDPLTIGQLTVVEKETGRHLPFLLCPPQQPMPFFLSSSCLARLYSPVSPWLRACADDDNALNLRTKEFFLTLDTMKRQFETCTPVPSNERTGAEVWNKCVGWQGTVFEIIAFPFRCLGQNSPAEGLCILLGLGGQALQKVWAGNLTPGTAAKICLAFNPKFSF